MDSEKTKDTTADTLVERFERRLELLEATVADLRIQQRRINTDLSGRIALLENRN